MPRKNFIDNIRWICILILIPYHTFMIYNAFGENFYIEGQSIIGTSAFIVALSPWFMPLLFSLAGISSYYSLQKRTPLAYAKERVFKLLIPLIAGVLLVVPAQTFIAERFHNGFTGGYFYQYVLFFTSPTDLTGTRGGFTPAHLWFILFLFVISMIALPIMIFFNKKKIDTRKMPLIISMFLLPLVLTPVLDFGHSLGRYFGYFILGYLLLSTDVLLEKLDNYRIHLLAVATVCMIVNLVLFHMYINNNLNAPYIAHDIFQSFYGWISILAILGLGRHYCNFKNKATDYLTGASFPVYIFHQSWVIVVAYWIFMFTQNTFVQIILIISTSFILTYATYEVCKRIRGLRFLLCLKTL
ncbi:MAG: acyltransferase family protein [Defluviitaleaceae bacterium]|nr:acyltransferase family protein [Defluviitaleaceae bacterium]